MKELRITVTVRNNLLVERREKLGLSQIQVAKTAQISINVLSRYERLNMSPIANENAARRTGSPWQESARRLSDFYGVEPHELFPEFALEAHANSKEMRLDSDEALALMNPEAQHLLAPDVIRDRGEYADALSNALARLRPREAIVLRQRFGLEDGREHSLKEVGQSLGVSAARAQQIEAEALSRLRHPKYKLTDFYEEKAVPGQFCSFCRAWFETQMELVAHLDQEHRASVVVPRPQVVALDPTQQQWMPVLNAGAEDEKEPRADELHHWVMEEIRTGHIALYNHRLIREHPKFAY